MFDKEKYWSEKKNNIGSKRKKPVLIPSYGRSYFRKKNRNNLFTRKNFIPFLNAIRIIRKQHGKIVKKYLLLDNKVVK